MRKLAWLIAGFAAGCGLCVLFLWERDMRMLVAIAFFLGMGCFALKSRSSFLRIPAFLLLGLACSFGWFGLYRAAYLQPIQCLDGQTLPLTVTITEFSKKTEYGYSVDGFVTFQGKPYRVRVYHNGEADLTPGTVLESNYRIRLTTPGGKKESTYFQSDGLFLLATQKGELNAYQSERNPIWFSPAWAAKTAQERIASFFPEDVAPFAKALMLGDTTDLDYELDTALKLSGIRHVVAVSGLHISILFGLIFLLLRTNRWLVLLVSVPVMVFFAAVTGFSPSVTRACLMTALMALGLAMKEEYDGLTGLSVAAFVMLLGNPYVVLSVSFQLSISSVFGILIFGPSIQRWFRKKLNRHNRKGFGGRMANWVSGSASVSISAQLLSVPFSAYYFHTISLVGILTNLFTIWLIGLVFPGIGAVCLLGGVLPSACGGLGWLLAWPIRFVCSLARLFSRIPFAAVYTASPYITAWLAVCYILLILFLLTGKRRGKWGLLIGAVGLLAAIGASILLPRRDTLRLNVLDVGEGQSILLQAGGENVLIDCGGYSDTNAADQVAQMLLSQGIFRLDGLVVTHYDKDHTNGIQPLLTRIDVKQFYLPDQGEHYFLRSLQARYGDLITMIDRDTELPFGTGTLHLLEPGHTKTDNENCMCVLFESEECVILITGDRSRAGERALLKKYHLPQADILIAGHHGSKNSTSRELLEAVCPQTVIISVGRDNGYGHPAQELLERLEEYHCTVYRTDLEGSVLVRR